MRCSLITAILASIIVGGLMFDRLEAAVPVVWDGSAGINGTYHAPTGFSRWEDGNWTKNATPGQTASATMGDNTGGRGGLDIVIGGGAKVFHDQNDSGTDPGALGDFKPRMDLNGPGSLTIKEGATLWMDSHTDQDGRWARMDINVNLDNGTLRTSHTPAFCPPSECSVTGGRIIFGYNNDLLQNTVLQWNITNGARIEMEGKMTWGNPNYLETPVDNPSTGHNPGIGMNMTINNGTLDLTGGNSYDDFFGLVNGELIFFYEWNGVAGTAKNEDYKINFTGPGSIIVDNGLFVVEQNSDGVFNPKGGVAPDLYTSVTYQDLWNFGILQANGVSGLTPGATFSTYFSTAGSPGMTNYTLTSLVAPPGVPGDYNDNGKVDGADYVVYRDHLGQVFSLPNEVSGTTTGQVTVEDYTAWRARFGNPPGSGAGLGAGSAVPEPASLVLILIGLAGGCLSGRSRNR